MCEVRWVTSRCPRYFSNSKETIPVSLPKSCDRVWNRVTKSTSQEEHTNDFLFLCKDLYLQREWTHAQSLISCTLGRCLFYFNAVYSTKCQWMTSCWHSAHCYQSFSSRLSKAIFPYPFCFVSLITITKMTTKPSNILSHEISLPAILLSLKCFGVKQRNLEHDSKGSPLKLSNSVWSVFTGCYHMRECPTSQHWECRMDDWQARFPHCANTWLDKPLTWVFCKMLEIRNEASTVNDSS